MKDTLYFNSKSEKWTTLIYKGEKTHYEVSSLGRIRNMKTGRILQQFIQNNEYWGFTISLGNKPHSMKTASVVAKHFIPNPKNKPQVNHKHGDCKWDNSVDNLEWVTAKENIRHAFDTGLKHGMKGEDSPMAIYTNKQIEKVCKLLEKNKLTPKEIYEKTGVTPATIANIYWGRRWSSVSCNFNVKNYTLLPVNSNIKHTEEQVIQACELLIKGVSTHEIERLTGLSNDAVKRIRLQKSFPHITKQYDFSNIKTKRIKKR